MSNHTNQTVKKERRKWKDEFLRVLSNSLSVTRAAHAVSMSRTYVYQARKLDPEFAKAWDDSIQQAIELAEAEMYRRAVEGVERVEGIYYQGEEVGRKIVREYSDTLLIFALKAHKPDKYRDRVEITTWQDKVVKGLRDGAIDPREVEAEFGNDLAQELFARAGLQLGQSREAKSQAEQQDDTD